MKKGALVFVVTKLELGGAQKMALSLLRGMREKGVDLYLITGTGGILEPEAQDIPGLTIFFVSDLVRPINPIKDFLAFCHIYWFIRRIKKGLFPLSQIIVHTHSSKAGILGRWAAFFAGVSLIFHTYHGFGFHDRQNIFLRKCLVFVEKLTSLITDRIIGVSHANIQKGETLGILKPEKTLLVHYGIDLSAFKRNGHSSFNLKSGLGFPPDAPLVGMIACFKPQKAPLDFVRMAQMVQREIPQCLFVMIGDGVLRPIIEKTIRDLGLKDKIFLLGWREDIPDLFGIMDIFVLTSLWEGMPICLLEASASGIPIVATHVDGTPEVVQNGGNGFLVSPRDVAGMSRFVIQLLKDQPGAKKMGKKGQQIVKSFEINRMVQTHQNLYFKEIL
ncbi:MAG TPA: glycosyltransferase family 4 protein [Nitrospiria bacterium]